MKVVYALAICLLVISACKSKKIAVGHAHHDERALQPTVDTLKKSIPKEVHAMISTSHITIKYHAPAVRGRQIWGGLVPYDEVWVTGAHMATTIEFNTALFLDSREIPPGKYAIFTIPGKDQWIIILNKNWDQHLADEYDKKDDVLRITVTPQAVENNQERLTYNVDQTGGKKATIIFRWEKMRIVIPIEVK